MARYKAASSVERLFTRVRSNLVGRMLSAVYPLDLSGVQAASNDDSSKRLDNQIGILQFSTAFTPEARPAEKIYQAREMLKRYSFNLACRMAQRLLPQYPELAEYVNKRGKNKNQVVNQYRVEHNDAPAYLGGLITICLDIYDMQHYSGTHPLYIRAFDDIDLAKYPFMDLVAKEALTEREQQQVGQILAYGHDLEFGRGTLEPTHKFKSERNQ